MKLISLNVEDDKHWELIYPFLEAEKPDVICLQEILENDVARVAERFGMESFFGPMTIKVKNGAHLKGIAIFSRTPMRNKHSAIYHPAAIELRESDPNDRSGTIRNLLLTAEADFEGSAFTIGTTHFTLTPDGLPDDNQRVDAQALSKTLSAFPDIALCGDFNMPRGFNDIYEQFTARYEDAIPRSYVTSIDPELHRVRNDPVNATKLAKYMVDYLFLSKRYRASDVRLQSGVSDHCAIIATLSVNSQ